MKPYTIHNFLLEEEFKNIMDVVAGPDIDWHYSHSVADGQVEEDEIYFCHLLYMGLAEPLKDGSMPPPPKKSEYYDLFEPVFNKLPEFNLLLRAKINLYGRTNELIHHADHIDMKMEHKGAVFSLNTCDGYTKFSDGTKVESVANRIVFFDASKEHQSTTTSNSKLRYNINFNFL